MLKKIIVVSNNIAIYDSIKKTVEDNKFDIPVHRINERIIFNKDHTKNTVILDLKRRISDHKKK